MNTERTLPTVEELHYDIDQAFKNDPLNLLLNQPPSVSWLKNYPAQMGIVGGGQYLPIDKVNFMLTYIFGEWYPEILREGVMFQSVYMVVRLHYKNPITKVWEFKDGCGATAVQTDGGKPASDLAAIKSRGVQIALPIAKQLAVKDAADELGKLFGRDLNRKDALIYSGAEVDITREPTPPKQYTQAEIHASNSNYVAPPMQPMNTAQAETVPTSNDSFTFNPNEL